MENMDFNSRLVSLILLLHISGSLTLEAISVQCNKQNICALRETQVTLECSYWNINIKTVFWFSQKQSTNWRKHDEPEDLTLDSDYSGRLKQQITNYDSTLIISDLRETDSGEYHLMFIMKDGVKYISSETVNLSVTVLQVKLNTELKDQRDQTVELTCHTSCKLTSRFSEYYYWIKNGKNSHFFERSITVSSSEHANSYSCSVKKDLTNPSSSVCVFDSNCWDVTYTSRRVCALVGSTVDIPSTYSHPTGYEVNKTFWHYVQSGLAFNDLLDEHQIAGRVEYVGNTLRISDIKMNDSREYQFRFITNTKDGKYSGAPGVILTVTDTKVIRSPAKVSDGDEVILSCSTKCTLNNNPTYIWYKNGQQVTDGFTISNKLYLDSVIEKELDEYSCTVGDSKQSTALRNTAIILSVFLSLALIGVLWYGRRKCTLSKNLMEAQYDSVCKNAASSDLTQKEDTNNQDQVHYCSIDFRHSQTKHNSSVPTAVQSADTTEEEVQYSTVMFS